MLIIFLSILIVLLSPSVIQASSFELNEENEARLQAALEEELIVRREKCQEVYRGNALFRTKEMFLADIEGCEKLIAQYPDEAMYKYRLFRNYLWPANESVNESRFLELLQFIRERAENGDPEAISIIADVYAVGHEHIKTERIEKDPWKSIDNYRKAAALGSCWAMTRLGEFYREGKFGIEESHENRKYGYEFYERAAECGHPEAITKVAGFYRFSVLWLPKYEQNINEAIELYEKAAEKRYWRAYGELVDIYAFWADELYSPREAALWFCKLPLKWRLKKWFEYYDGRKLGKIPIVFDFISCEYREVIDGAQ